MTGWRVGWMVVPEPLVRPIERLQQNLSISVPTLSQIAAEAAFEGRDEMEAIKHGYQENRRILIEGLPQGRARPIPAGRRRVLSLRRRLGIHLRQFRLRRRDAGKGPCRGDPGHRLRSGPRPPVHPLFLCALGRRDARGRGAHRALARIARCPSLSMPEPGVGQAFSARSRTVADRGGFRRAACGGPDRIRNSRC